MTKLHINDANILIDIIHLDLVKEFMALEFELYTTNFVFAELDSKQQAKLKSKKLIKINATEEEMRFIFELMEQHGGLSFEDCSMWYFAKEMNGILVTGDGSLRAKAKLSGVEVRGVIYILEAIKKQAILPVNDCIEKLERLKVLNKRLPMAEIDKRIAVWGNEI